MPQRPASAVSSGVERPAVRLRLALEVGRRALEQHRARVVADRADLRDLLGAEHARPAHGGQLGALGLDRLRAPGLLDQRRRDDLHRPVRQVPVAGELEHRQPVTLRDRPHRVELRAPRLDPARRPEAAVVVLRELVPLEHVVVEEPAVVDDAGDHLHAVALGGGQHELTGPRLERVEDHHRPVDPVAEALQAVDHVEREAVRGARRDAQLPRQPVRAHRLQCVPDRLARVARAIGVMQQQKVEGIDPQRSRLRSVAIRT